MLSTYRLTASLRKLPRPIIPIPCNISVAASVISVAMILKEAKAKDEIIRKNIIRNDAIFRLFFITPPYVLWEFSFSVAILYMHI
jgi:hypothetical protein